MNIWTSPSSGMDFFKVGLKTSMWLYRAEKKTNHRLPLSSEERAGISCKPPGTSGILSTRRVALFKGKAPYIHPKSVSFEVCVETGAKVQLSKRGGNGTFDGSTPRNGASPMALGEQIPSFLTPAARLVTVTGPVHSVHAAWLGTKVWGVREDGWKATSFFLIVFFFFFCGKNVIGMVKISDFVFPGSSKCNFKTLGVWMFQVHLDAALPSSHRRSGSVFRRYLPPI